MKATFPQNNQNRGTLLGDIIIGFADFCHTTDYLW